jgi:hypothetical protein
MSEDQLSDAHYFHLAGVVVFEAAVMRGSTVHLVLLSDRGGAQSRLCQSRIDRGARGITSALIL